MNDYQQGFSNGWSAALGKVGESLKRLETQDYASNRARPIPDEALREAGFKGACESDPLYKLEQHLSDLIREDRADISSLRSAMQMLGKRLDETQATLRGTRTSLSDAGGIQERMEALGELAKDNIAMRVELANRVVALEDRQGEVDSLTQVRSRVAVLELIAGGVQERLTTLENASERRGPMFDYEAEMKSIKDSLIQLHVRVGTLDNLHQEERLGELESAVQLEKALLRGLDTDSSKQTARIASLERENTNTRVDLQALTTRVFRTEYTGEKLNGLVSALDQRTISSLQIGGVADPLPIGTTRKDPNGV